MLLLWFDFDTEDDFYSDFLGLVSCAFLLIKGRLIGVIGTPGEGGGGKSTSDFRLYVSASA